MGKHMRDIPILLAFACSVVLTPLSSSADDLDKVLKRLETGMEQVNTLSTGFVQEKELAVFKKKLTLTGNAYMRKPDMFAWHLEDPIEYRMVINGKSMTQWDGESDKVQKINLGKNPALAAATKQMRQWFGGRYSSLTSEYVISIKSQSPVVLEFVPKKENVAGNYIRSVTVSFRKDEKYINSIRVVEKEGDSTLLSFKGTTLNGEVPDKAWQVKP
jgi:outer membrane lipoprotein-sorting protein